ncbi:MAG: gas vesicle protein GvpG [Streptosporangiales bacterium]
MGLFTGLLTLPLAPVRATAWIAERVREQAEAEYYDPATIRRQLEEVDEARAAGVLSDEEADELENQLMARLLRA